MNTATASHRTARPPARHLLALELRAPFEAAATLAWWPLLTLGPRGDGHTVLVFPGLAASDSSTQLLRSYLQRIGYDARGWQQGTNRGAHAGLLEGCAAQVRELRRASGRKISLVGWSLGGVYAREVAKAVPDDVRLVISLGTPFTGHQRSTNAWRSYESMSGQTVRDAAVEPHIRQAPPVPTTSIFSRTDGIVDWSCSVEIEGPQAENIEVRASHIGMGAHPAVLHAIADRLAQREGQWRAFERHGLRRLVYGDPQRGH